MLLFDMLCLKHKIPDRLGIANADFSDKISDGVKDLSFSVTVN